jgi:hypothetical protein
VPLRSILEKRRTVDVLTTEELLNNAIKKHCRAANRADQMQVASILKDLGYVETRGVWAAAMVLRKVLGGLDGETFAALVLSRPSNVRPSIQGFKSYLNPLLSPLFPLILLRG